MSLQTRHVRQKVQIFMTMNVLKCLHNSGWPSLLKVMTHLLIDVNVA